jgi:segregation and condensation protein A
MDETPVALPLGAQGFTVRTEAFEGPLELILDLIEKRRLLVNELSLATITDEFISFVKGNESFPLEDATQFLSVAATLLLIKSRSLLPDLELTSEEEQDMDALQRRLKLYEQAREAARMLGEAFGRAAMAPRGERAPEVAFSPSADLTLANLQQSLKDLLARLEKEPSLPEVRIRPLVSLEEMMDTLRVRVERAFSLSFKEFTGDKGEKVEVIVSFLALLELVKQGSVDAVQHGHFGDIKIEHTGSSVPRYG